jgi:hypothetical protein
MPHRTYVILDAADVDSVDFSEVHETSEDTLRWSVDETKTFVKFPKDSATPSFLDGKTQYTYAEIMPILRGEDWTSPNNNPE